MAANAVNRDPSFGDEAPNEAHRDVQQGCCLLDVEQPECVFGGSIHDARFV
ncbi:MAG: hypothetical protein ACT4OX_01995 [Actinomycetota bacterium]